jgi:hypothetical protein
MAYVRVRGTVMLRVTTMVRVRLRLRLRDGVRVTVTGRIRVRVVVRIVHSVRMPICTSGLGASVALLFKVGSVWGWV